jgi:hypothetical protein
MKEVMLPWTKEETGLQILLGINQVLSVQLGDEWSNEIPNITWNFTASSTSSAENFVVRTCYERNFTRAILLEIHVHYGEALSHTEISWLSRGTVFNHFLVLRVEAEMFMNKKGKFMTELCNKIGFFDLEFLCDIRHQLNGLNTKLQGQLKPICNMFWAVRAFVMQLRLFPKNVKNVNVLIL